MKAQLQLNADGSQTLLFDCPGCGMLHATPVSGSKRPAWQWNNRLDAPTLTPSVLVTWTRYDAPQMCHSFVRDGRIEFLGDCTHALKGRTVDLPEWEE